MIVRGLCEVEVRSEAEALNLLYTGQLARTTAQHKLNRNSNRSHSIFTVVLKQQSRSGVSERVVTSKLNLVDLAGSERLKKTMESADGAHGGYSAPIDETLKKESMYINQSLTYLEQCVVALGRRNAHGGVGGGHVAYRQTKLTSILKDSLGGNCATLLFACIWGEAAHLEETVSTLRLATRMMRVQNSQVAVEVADPVKLAKRQDAVIRELRQELLMHDALNDRSGVKYEPYTPEERAQLAAQVKRFADAADDDRTGAGNANSEILQFESVRQMKEMCAEFKRLLRDAEAKAQRATAAMMDQHSQRAASRGQQGGDDAVSQRGDSQGQGGFGDTAATAHFATGLGSDDQQVGQLERGRGFSLGAAADSARPLSTDFSNANGRPTGEPNNASNGAASFALGTGGGGRSADGGSMTGFDETADFGLSSSMPLSPNNNNGGGGGQYATDASLFVDLSDKSRSFEYFKRAPGAAPASAVQRSKRARNDAKRRIDDAASAIAEKRRQRLQRSRASGGDSNTNSRTLGATADVDDVVDEEEFVLMKSEREAKKAYRDAHSGWIRAKSEHETCKHQVDVAKAALLDDFQRWFDRQHEANEGQQEQQQQRRRRPRSSNAAVGTSSRGRMGHDDEDDEDDEDDDDDDDDKLDDQEQFDKMEMERIISQDPDALAFFQAQKTRRANMTQNRTQLRQMHRNKRA